MTACRSNLFSDFVIGLLLFVAGFFVIQFQSAQFARELNSSAPKVYPVKGLEHMTFGYREVVADSLWIRVIQDFHYCENIDRPKGFNPAKDIDTILSGKIKDSRCNKGWVFQMIDVLTDMAPRFRYAYRTGATGLSIGVDDREGARIIYEKGLKAFPDYWQLAFEAAYHQLFEMQNASRAADLLLQANRYGGPPWLPFLASRLYDKLGQIALAKSVLNAYLATPLDEGTKARAKMRLKQLEESAKDATGQ